ncbi:hypothetical protein PFISCL1PPCAC_26866, partial [Pristionchus fissidentatus]
EKKEEEKREEKEGKVESISAEKKDTAPSPLETLVKVEETSQVDPLSQISVDSVDSKSNEEEVKKEKKEEIIRPSLVEKAFTPLRESPPPFEEFAPASKSSSEEPPSIPEETEESPRAVAESSNKDSSILFDTPPPFEPVEDKAEEDHDEGNDIFSEDSDTEVMQGNRAAFMAQLNAKLAAKPPSGMGIRPMSMVETPTAPFVPPTADRQSVVIDRPPTLTRRAVSETKPEGPISHVNKSRPKGPARRPPTAKKLTSSIESEEGTTKFATLPRAVPSSTTVSKPIDPITVPKSTPPKSPVASSPKKEAPVVFRKTSDPKSPPASISRKSSSSSSLGHDADPLSALSAVHTSPYKGPSAAKPPMSRPSNSSSVSSSVAPAAAKPESLASTKKTDTKPKKSVFDSDSDDFFEKIGGSKTLPAKSSAFKNELESALAKEKNVSSSASSSKKKGLFDDSDDDLEMFRKKK